MVHTESSSSYRSPVPTTATVHPKEMRPSSPRKSGLALLVGCALASTWCGGAPTAPSASSQVSTLGSTSGTANEVPNDGVGRTEPPPPTTPAPPPSGTASAWLSAIADTGWCGSRAMPQVARLLDHLDGDVLLVGDLAYMNGLLDEFRRCFDPDFGRFGARLRPAPGNHDYGRPDADGYFTYFGERAGPGRRGYYAFTAGEWQVLMLNSSVPIGRHSEQYAWVQQQLQQAPARCTLAAVHHPFDNSGTSGANPWLRDVWELLHAQGADIVVSGHDHLYERFAPQDASQRPDPARGVRQFIAGTGGAPLYPRSRSAINSEIVIQAHGVLRLKLDPASYEWTFLDVNGTALDLGMGTCH